MLDTVREAFYTARQERVPVVLGVPMDLQKQPFPWGAEYSPSTELMPTPQRPAPDPVLVDQLAAMIARARHCVRVLKERRGEKFLVVAARLAASLRANVEAHRTRIGRGRERTLALAERARRATQNLIERRGAMLERSAQLLNALSYHGVLARGFALVRDPERRPVLAGLLIGCLTWKPQFGILLPVALAASNRWRAFASAAMHRGPSRAD